MDIKIKIDGKTLKTKLVKEGLLENQNLINHVTGLSKNLDIRLINLSFLDPATGSVYIYENGGTPFQLMLNDVMNEDSFTFKKLSSIFKGSDAIKNKLDMFEFLCERYVENIWNMDMNSEEPKFELYATYLTNSLYYKFMLPKDIASRIRNHDFNNTFYDTLDLLLLSDEQIFTYIAPRYYHEIGMFDRESVRANKELMENLSKEWFYIGSEASRD